MPGEGDWVEYSGPAYLVVEDEVAWAKAIEIGGKFVMEEYVADEHGEVLYLLDMLSVAEDEPPRYAVKGEDWPEEVDEVLMPYDGRDGSLELDVPPEQYTDDWQTE